MLRAEPFLLVLNGTSTTQPNKSIYMKSIIITFSAVILVGLASCNKNKCEECHYDKAGQEIPLGEVCGDEMEALEANGYTDSTGNYVVHCAH